MILDSSAIIAIVLREPGFEEVEGKIADAISLGIGAPTLTETLLALENRMGDARSVLIHFLQSGRSMLFRSQRRMLRRRQARLSDSGKANTKPP